MNRERPRRDEHLGRRAEADGDDRRHGQLDDRHEQSHQETNLMTSDHPSTRDQLQEDVGLPRTTPPLRRGGAL